MVRLWEGGAYLLHGTELIAEQDASAQIKNKTGKDVSRQEAAQNTIAYRILKEHNTSGNMEKLKIKFDKLTSHDITFVGIGQTARASGLTKFPIPYVLTNCHNSLCAVGGTINEDDHMFGLTCAKKYGGVYVPPHQAVIHQYAREMMAGGGKMMEGDILFEGTSLLSHTPDQWRRLRGTAVSMIFQDSGAMLNPIRKIGDVFAEYIRTHENMSRKEAWRKGVEMLERMRLPGGDNIMNSYPFQLSGGMRQRVGIAMATTFQPKLLLADEPTSALDVTTQAQIVRQMMELRDVYGTSIIVVTHNMQQATRVSDLTGFFMLGRLVEFDATEKIFSNPSLKETEDYITGRFS